MSRSSDLTLTIIALIFLAGLAIIALRNHFAEKPSIKPHRAPWMIICLGSIATGFMVIVHLVNLMGFETGRM
ncbi:hypothetical protein DES40_1935 [Litorimonas taeanensis]|uniref:Uncharacterized protein n=1 Tax=Litorimonas taeanensis TaxID=568099 RepID=A0A420WDU3_9PROT|nr:hypothetical protein [Litorimonas taeanensis]RKQ69148.1 hypothetical protein DES40_1935 [Litorimonas taeanensis]